MNILLKIHKELTENDFNQLWNDGRFVFDTNVLLDLYRLPENARDDLLNILADEKLSSRIWMPFQVLLEFVNNRVTTISNQKNTFSKVEKILSKAKGDIEGAFSEMKAEISKLQLEKRHSSINPSDYIDSKLIKEPLEKINQFIKDLKKLDKKQPDVNDKDLLKDKILALFEGKIGNSLSKEELEDIYKEGEKRFADKVPPGYLDVDKGKDDRETEYYLFEDKKFIRRYGDLIIWNEIIKKAKERNLEHIVFVTNDLKEDWVKEKRGKKLGARIELLNEIYFKANSVKLFHIYDTSSFMEYSKKYLSIEVKDESIQETKDLIDYNAKRLQQKGNQKVLNNPHKIHDYLINKWNNIESQKENKNDLTGLPKSNFINRSKLFKDIKHFEDFNVFTETHAKIYNIFQNENYPLSFERIHQDLNESISPDILEILIEQLVEKNYLHLRMMTNIRTGETNELYSPIDIW